MTLDAKLYWKQHVKIKKQEFDLKFSNFIGKQVDDQCCQSTTKY